MCNMSIRGKTLTFPITHIPGDLFFITGSIIHWEPIFTINVYANIILKSISWHRQNHRMFVFAFALMPNHIHWISKPVDPYTINNNIKSFASFTAHKIIKTARLNIFLNYSLLGENAWNIYRCLRTGAGAK